jgi:hypothetical protein
MKHDLRIELSDNDGHLAEIWEIKQVGSRSRIFDTVIEHLAAFEDGKLVIKISKEG